MSSHGRALSELGIELIHANTPQAKGRIERSFSTLQDRLVKEMRLRNISDIETANDFLKEYLPIFNSKFNVIPFDNTDVNVKIGGDIDLDSYLCIKQERTVKNDNTISHNAKIYQLKPIIRAKTVTVEEHMDNSIHIKYDGKYLEYKEIIKRPTKITEKVIKIRKKYIPPAHILLLKSSAFQSMQKNIYPWRQTFKKYFKPKLSQTADEK